MKSIYVLGANGQLAQSLKKISPELTYLSRAQVDLEKPEQVKTFFKKNKAELIVNLAAYTNVELAEEERQRAHIVNAESVGALAASCARLIHISTDFVFSGDKNSPYTEKDLTGPINHYGMTKLDGEKKAFQQNDKVTVIRTSLVYSEFGSNFIQRMLEILKNKDHVESVHDVVGSATAASDLAEFLNLLIRDEKSVPSGIFHYSNEGLGSRYDMVKAICRIKKINTPVSPVSSLNFPSKAMRPAYSVLDKTKIKSTFGIQIPHWYDSLEKFLAQT